MKETLVGIGLGIWVLLLIMSTFNGVFFAIALVYPFAMALVGYNLGLLSEIIQRKIMRSSNLQFEQ